MPRRSRRDETPGKRRHGKPLPPMLDVEDIRARIAGPPALGKEGYEVRTTSGDRRYRCPYCEGAIEPGTVHVVAFRSGEAEDRRHYHAGCWVKARGSPS